MIREQIISDLSQILKKLGLPVSELTLEHPKEESFGDYSTNITLKVKKPGVAPYDLAVEIISAWRSAGLPSYLAKIEVAGGGFINLWLSKDYFLDELKQALVKGDKYGFYPKTGKTVVIDYSSPNIAKPFGIGHLRSTNIGQAIYNLYKALGWKTVGDNHLGDWGTQFGKLVYQIDLKINNENLKLKDLTIEKLEKLYVEFHRLATKKPELEDESRAWFKRLEEGDSEAKKIWQKCVDVSLAEFERIYQLLGVKMDYAIGESFYNKRSVEVLEEAKKKRLAVLSEGALIMPLSETEPPLMLLKSDEATTYHLRDLACIKYRVQKWQSDLIIYEVGVDQKLYFQQLFEAAQRLGYIKKEQLKHVAHGLIRWEKGKFSTRTGATVHLEEVLEEAIKKAGKIIKNSATGRGLKIKEQEHVARAVGIGAVKYSDLKQNPQTDVIFDWDRIFALEGDSGPYLQYTYARCKSVLEKGKWSAYSRLNRDLASGSTKSALGQTKSARQGKLENEEMALLRLIYRFPEVIEEAAVNFSPNLLCTFLFQLAQKYNLLYNKLPILKADGETRNFRLALTQATAQILKNGLGILGISVLEKM